MTLRWRLEGGAALALLACAVAGFALPRAAAAAEFKSVSGDAPAVLYDAPTLRGRKLAIAPRGMPVEIVVTQGDWERVRDSSGEFSWIEKRSLSDRRTLILATNAVLHGAADDHAPPVLRLDQGVLVELVEPPSNGYVHVRYRDGTQGWLKAAEVWGL